MSRCDHVTYQGLASLIDGRNFLQKLHAADCLHVSFPNITLSTHSLVLFLRNVKCPYCYVNKIVIWLTYYEGFDPYEEWTNNQKGQMSDWLWFIVIF